MRFVLNTCESLFYSVVCARELLWTIVEQFFQLMNIWGWKQPQVLVVRLGKNWYMGCISIVWNGPPLARFPSCNDVAVTRVGFNQERKNVRRESCIRLLRYTPWPHPIHLICFGSCDSGAVSFKTRHVSHASLFNLYIMCVSKDRLSPISPLLPMPWKTSRAYCLIDKCPLYHIVDQLWCLIIK